MSSSVHRNDTNIKSTNIDLIVSQVQNPVDLNLWQISTLGREH